MLDSDNPDLDDLQDEVDAAGMAWAAGDHDAAIDRLMFVVDCLLTEHQEEADDDEG